MIYIYRYKDKCVEILQKHFGKNALFYSEIPANLEEQIILNLFVCLDDYEDLISSKRYAPMVLKWASYLCHHKLTNFCISVQTLDIFYAKSRLNGVIHQCSILILFRSLRNSHLLRRILNSYNVQLNKNEEKSDETLYDLFQSHCNEKYKYLFINLSAELNKPIICSGIIYSDNDDYVLFT